MLIRQKYVWKEGKMKKQIQNYCERCTTCIRFKSGNHAQFASPRVTISAPIPFASLACDVMDMPPAPNGYDGILVCVCTYTKYTVLIPICSKGLISPEVRQHYKQYSGKSNAWDSARLAYKMYKRLFSIFGLATQMRTDGQSSLMKSIWPHVMRLLGIEQLVGTAMSSDSNGIAENRIKTLRRMFNPIMERLGATGWKFATPTVQAIANATPNSDSEITPEQLVLAYAPRRITDLIHDVSTLPDSDIKRLLEDRATVMEEIRLSNCEAQQASTERMMQRQAGMFRDLPKDWGKPGKSWWVWLHEKFYSNHSRTAQLRVSWSTKVGSAHGAAAVARSNLWSNTI